MVPIEGKDGLASTLAMQLHHVVSTGALVVELECF